MFQQDGEVRQTGRSPYAEDLPRFSIRIWLLFLLISAVLSAVAFACCDLPIAFRVAGWLGSKKASLSTGFASDVLLGLEGAVAFSLVIIRLTRGRLSPFREATALACLASICAYAINDSALKVFFGVPDPGVVLQGAPHVFHLLKGTPNGGFPSGHMVIAGAFAGVYMRLYRRSILPLATLLFVAAVLLIIGDWHFLSDVIAGSFVGVSAGLLAGELWLAHAN